jgi:hypothetical protein
MVDDLSLNMEAPPIEENPAHPIRVGDAVGVLMNEFRDTEGGL